MLAEYATIPAMLTFAHQKKPPNPNQIFFFSDEEKF